MVRDNNCGTDVIDYYVMEGLVLMSREQTIYALISVAEAEMKTQAKFTVAKKKEIVKKPIQEDHFVIHSISDVKN